MSETSVLCGLCSRCAVLIVLLVPILVGQTLEFEAASFKVAARGEDMAGEHGGPGTEAPGRWTCGNVSLKNLIMRAWNLQRFEISGPSSLDTERYDVAAKLPPGTSMADFRSMIQHLLKERLALVVHFESRDDPIYELVIAKSGLKMKKAEAPPGNEDTRTPFFQRDADGKPQIPAGRPMTFHASFTRGVVTQFGRMQTIQDLIETFEPAARRRIVDRTGLEGIYDYRFEWTLPSHDDTTGEASAPGSPLLQALQEELGLKLVPKLSRVEILVVDSFRKSPVDN